jgi:aromatic aminotransferase
MGGEGGETDGAGPGGPGSEDDEAVVAWLVREAGVCIIPGSSCGAPGYVRAAYANLRPEECAEAAGRLKSGLRQIVAAGGGLPQPSLSRSP